MKSKSLFMAFLALFLISMALFAESGWKRVKNSNGIQVYTRSVAGSDLDEFKGITVVDARIEVIGEVIRDRSEEHTSELQSH